MVYVIGDVHGCYDKLMEMFELIKFDRRKDEVYFVGDYIDKGPDSYKMLCFIDEYSFYNEYHFIKGNHEAEFISYVDILNSIDSDKSKLELCEILHDRFEYFDMYGTIRKMLADNEIRPHANARLTRWSNMMRKMPLYEMIDYKHFRYTIVHAGYCPKQGPDNFEDFALYAREKSIAEGGRRRATIISGHTPTVIPGTFAYNHGNVFKHYNEQLECTFYDIDCGCCLKSKYEDAKLACIRLDDNEIFYV